MPEKQNHIVLASGSPRRSELLSALGLGFSVEVSGVDEDALHTGVPVADAPRAAYAKAAAVAKGLNDGLVLGADTMVALDGRIFGKPSDRAQAREFLETLSGRTHTVFTGVALIEVSSGRSLVEVEATPVTFKKIGYSDLEAYARGQLAA